MGRWGLRYFTLRVKKSAELQKAVHSHYKQKMCLSICEVDLWTEWTEGLKQSKGLHGLKKKHNM